MHKLHRNPTAPGLPPPEACPRGLTLPTPLCLGAFAQTLPSAPLPSSLLANSHLTSKAQLQGGAVSEGPRSCPTEHLRPPLSPPPPAPGALTASQPAPACVSPSLDGGLPGGSLLLSRLRDTGAWEAGGAGGAGFSSLRSRHTRSSRLTTEPFTCG